jgi:hypothetical protein
MKRLLVILSLAVGILLVAPAPEASAWSGWSSSSRSGHHQGRHHQHRRSGKTVKTGVPELDPGAAGSALVLLFGGIAYISSRRREDGLA